MDLSIFNAILLIEVILIILLSNMENFCIYISNIPFLLIGSFAEEDVGRHGINMPSTVGTANASRGLEVAVANLQDYCNGKFSELLLNKFFHKVNFLPHI